MKELSADFTSHPIQGIARAARENGKSGLFKVPLISHVEGNLYQGGCINGVKLHDDFHHVVSLYPWEQYALGPNTTRSEYKLHDSSEVPPSEQLHQIADEVIANLPEGKVLVHCQAGLNRSGLIAGLVLIKLGRTPQEAIDLLREKRCNVVLCNIDFEQWLLEEANASA